jgi:hypothetical protein
MISVVFAAIVVVLATTTLVLWVHPNYDDCLLGRIGLLLILGGAVVAMYWMVVGQAHYEPYAETITMLGGQATFNVWLVWRFLRKQRRIRRGLDVDRKAVPHA